MRTRIRGIGHLRQAESRYLRTLALDVPITRTLQTAPDVQICRSMVAAQENQTEAQLVGANIRARRRAAGLSQQQASDQVGMKRQHLAGWENGYHRPKQASLEKLARLLGCHWTDFYNEQEGGA